MRSLEETDRIVGAIKSGGVRVGAGDVANQGAVFPFVNQGEWHQGHEWRTVDDRDQGSESVRAHEGMQAFTIILGKVRWNVHRRVVSGKQGAVFDDQSRSTAGLTGAGYDGTCIPTPPIKAD